MVSAFDFSMGHLLFPVDCFRLNQDTTM